MYGFVFRQGSQAVLSLQDVEGIFQKPVNISHDKNDYGKMDLMMAEFVEIIDFVEGETATLYNLRPVSGVIFSAAVAEIVENVGIQKIFAEASKLVLRDQMLDLLKNCRSKS